MDLRDPKIQKILIGAVAFFIIVYFWYTRLYTSYDNQLAQMTSEYETMITNLKNVEMKSKSLEALKLEYTELLSRYHEIEQLLPEVKQIPSFLVQLHTASSLTGTNILKIEPRPINPESFYNVASFEIEMSGGYHEFGKFLGYVANFPFIANISDIGISATEVASFGTGQASAETAMVGPEDIRKKPTVNAKFVLSTYFVKSDERLMELEI
jgi:type IV pilus assembly protein PilO